MRQFNKLRKLCAFTLIEIIIVLAIISFLSAIVIVAINPIQTFINARNSQRTVDIGALQLGFSRYLGDSSSSGTPNAFSDFPGYSALLTSALAGTAGACPLGASSGITSAASITGGAYNIDSSANSSPSSPYLDIKSLISGGYLQKFPTDPSAGADYQACIDTYSGNPLVIFSSQTENKSSYIATTVGTIQPFTPTYMSNLQVWYDASQITGKTSGNTISTWSDSSGNNRNVTQATPANQPTFQANVLNTYPVVRFNGSSNTMTSAATAIDLTSGGSMFLVTRINNTNPMGIFYYNGGTNGSFMDWYMGGGQARWEKGDTSPSNIASIYGNLSTNQFALLSGLDNKLYINGAFQGQSSASSYYSLSTNAITLGNYGGYYSGDLAEIVIYNKVLSSADRQVVEKYLNQKYSLY